MIQRKIKKLRVDVISKNWRNTNLPAGLFSVVSSLDEFMCFIIFHWSGKWGYNWTHIPPPMVSNVEHFTYEDNTVNAEMLCVIFFNLMFSGRTCEDFLNGSYSQAKHTLCLPQFQKV